MPARLTLTFDNGPTPGVTERVLDTLAERGIKATFFVVGTDLLRDQRRELAARAAADGHWHGNHTMTHSIRFGDSDDPELPEREIGRSQEVLGDLAHPDRLFRPWGNGSISPRILSRAAIDYLGAGAYTCVLWNCVPRDWEEPDGWVDRALHDIDRQDWTVLVLHDQETGAMRWLPRFLDQVEHRDIAYVQSFPDSCVPIRRGRPTGPLEHLYINNGSEQ
jgi:peptidoglycan/xylan/chitin deacetylase (PgdA/CDA1 family)